MSSASPEPGRKPATPPGGSGQPPAAPTPPERERRGIPGVAIASIVAGILLVLVLLPEVLLYPAEPEAPPQPDWTRELATLQAHNEALEEEVTRLEGLLGGGICRLEDGTLQLPGADPAAPDPANPDPASPDPANPEPGGQKTELPAEILSPELVSATPPAGGAAVPLVELLDNSVALVVAINADGFTTGSAFAVAPGLMLTNRHVIEGATEVWVVNQGLGEVRPAAVRAATPGSGLGERDYALLAVEGAEALPALGFAPLNAAVERLTDVVAAGFPGMLLTTDQQYQALIEGDATAIPSLVLTQGIVTVVQQGGTVPLVVHSAQVSPGNSGGPLVDLCGRVVGINAFVQGDATSAHVNYALAGNDLAAFLAEAGVSPTVIDGACQPQSVAAAATPQ